MNISKSFSGYITSGYFNGKHFIAIADTIAKSIDLIFQKIAIYQSTEAWKGFNY